MKSSIIVETSTRDGLKQIGAKGETYNEIIKALLDLKRKKRIDPLDGRIETLQSSGPSR